MTREEVIEKLRPHEGKLRRAGVNELFLFGSTARNEAGRRSDVDLACALDESKRLGLFEFIGLGEEIGRILRRKKIDLVERHCMRPRVRAAAERDMVRIF